MKKCVWIGIGAVIGESNALYRDLIGMRELLDKKYDNISRARFHLNLYDLAVPEENFDRIIKALLLIAADRKKILIRVK